MPETLRLFIAVELPVELRPGMEALLRELPDDGLKKVELNNLHITLKFLGEVAGDKEVAIKDALRTVSFAPFTVRLNGVGVFPHANDARVVWVGCESAGLTALAEKINAAMAPLFRKETFSAHLTIARMRKRVDLHSFLQAHGDARFGEWEVREVQLKESVLSGKGPVYRTRAVRAADRDAKPD